MRSGRTPVDGYTRLAMIVIATAALWFFVVALALTVAGSPALLVPALIATPLTLVALVLLAGRLPSDDEPAPPKRENPAAAGNSRDWAMLGSNQ
jgi:hypothetical protein